MRLDVFLKAAGLAKTRTLAKALCDKNRIILNGQTAKASKEIKEGDVLEIDYGTKKIKIIIRKVPESKNIPRKERKELYELTEIERKWF